MILDLFDLLLSRDVDDKCASCQSSRRLLRTARGTCSYCNLIACKEARHSPIVAVAQRAVPGAAKFAAVGVDDAADPLGFVAATAALAVCVCVCGCACCCCC